VFRLFQSLPIPQPRLFLGVDFCFDKRNALPAVSHSRMNELSFSKRILDKGILNKRIFDKLSGYQLTWQTDNTQEATEQKCGHKTI